MAYKLLSGDSFSGSATPFTLMLSKILSELGRRKVELINRLFSPDDSESAQEK